MWTLESLFERANDTMIEINGNWMPCRPLPWYGLQGVIRRAKSAWAVFTGRADAFVWPEGQ